MSRGLEGAVFHITPMENCPFDKLRGAYAKERMQQRLGWALSLHEMGYRENARNMLESIARYVSREESEVLTNGCKDQEREEIERVDNSVRGSNRRCGF